MVTRPPYYKPLSRCSTLDSRGNFLPVQSLESKNSRLSLRESCVLSRSERRLYLPVCPPSLFLRALAPLRATLSFRFSYCPRRMPDAPVEPLSGLAADVLPCVPGAGGAGDAACAVRARRAHAAVVPLRRGPGDRGQGRRRARLRRPGSRGPVGRRQVWRGPGVRRARRLRLPRADRGHPRPEADHRRVLVPAGEPRGPAVPGWQGRHLPLRPGRRAVHVAVAVQPRGRLRERPGAAPPTPRHAAGGGPLRTLAPPGRHLRRGEPQLLPRRRAQEATGRRQGLLAGRALAGAVGGLLRRRRLLVQRPHRRAPRLRLRALRSREQAACRAAGLRDTRQDPRRQGRAKTARHRQGHAPPRAQTALRRAGHRLGLSQAAGQNRRDRRPLRAERGRREKEARRNKSRRNGRRFPEARRLR